MSATEEDKAFREYALTAHPLRVLLVVCGPLAVYQALQQVFRVLDTLMAAHVGSDAVSAVAVFSQITLMVTAIGSGLAAGGCIKISEAYGQGDYELVQKRTSTLYALVVAVSLAVMVMLVPFARPFLRLLRTPEELIAAGAGYFRIEILSLIAGFFNSVYIAVERSRGHSRRIMMLNLLVIMIKLSLSAFFVYVLEGGVAMIAWATLLSQAVLLAYAAARMARDEGAFRFSLSSVSPRGDILLPILDLSYPVTAEKMLFAGGKVIVNSMSGRYGPLTAGALGVSNNIGGLTTNWHAGMLDGASAVISQNRGAGRHGRTTQMFYWLLLVDVVIGVTGLAVVSPALPRIAAVFAQSKNGLDEVFLNMIVGIHRWEMLGYVTLGVNSAVNALMLGCGYAKRTMLLNLARVFVFRIPVLWYVQNYTLLGAEAVGVTMMVSNIAVGAASVLAVLPVLRELRRKAEGGTAGGGPPASGQGG